MGSDNSKQSNDSKKGQKTKEAAPPKEGVPVYVNVYNLQRTQRQGATTLNGAMGFGVYHSGVEILGVEWSFGGNPQADASQPGIFCIYPRTALPPNQFHEQVEVMRIPGLTQQKAQTILSSMMKEWMAVSYHLLNHNCNHFAEAFADMLGKEFAIDSKDIKLPKYINRAARFGDVLVPDVIYKSMMKSVPQPPQGNSSANFTTGGGSQPQSGGQQQQQQQQQAKEAEAATTIPIPQTREELKTMKVKEIKTMMWVNGIDWTGCVEKDDLVDAVMKFNDATKK